MDMGLGKTVCTLTAIKELMYDYFDCIRVLIIAPKKVAESTWDDEALKWEHTKSFKIVKVLGTSQKRIKALNTKADIYVINRDNVSWLVSYYSDKKWPFDTVILDESSSFKSPKSIRFKSLRRIRPKIKRIVCLTGTPTSNSLEDIWAQIYLLDRGERLCKTKTMFLHNWFLPNQRNGSVVYNYKPGPGSDQEIYDAIADISFSMQAADYLQLPERVDNIINVNMSPKQKALYKTLERDLVLNLPTGDISAATAAVLSNKLLQLANGASYDNEQQVIHIHDAKLDALQEITETGKNLLVFYGYKHDRIRLLERFQQAKTLETDKDIKAWNAGKIKILIAHPASVGYGLNLQAGGNVIVWYGLTWSLEQYQQANARLYRQGQKEAVIIHHLVCKGTIDERVIQALQNKEQGQKRLIDAVKAKIREYRG